MDRDNQFPVFHITFYDGGESALLLGIHVRTAADYLGPTPSGFRGIVAIAMLMGRYNQLTTSLVQERPPEFGTCALPRSIICSVPGI